MWHQTFRGAALCAILLAHRDVRALANWYTPPGGPPTGSTDGDKVRGVNLGGWLILEGWMMPDFMAVPPLDQHDIPDEWTYCSVLGKNESQSRLEALWDTYVQEADFQMFKTYGINTIRIPIGYWAYVDILDTEPYVAGQLRYLERVFGWAKSYGIDVMMDLHGLPGSQNGQDHSGRKGNLEVFWASSNTDRSLAALEAMTKHATDTKWGGVVKALEIVNEPHLSPMWSDGMTWEWYADFLVRAYQVIRSTETIPEGCHEIMIVVHDAFQPILNWQYFWNEPSLGLNWTNYALDSHYYDAFGDSANKSYQQHLDSLCAYQSDIWEAQTHYPVIFGEFSLGVGTYCVDYQSCVGKNLSDYISPLVTQDDALFLRQFWELQVDVFESAAGWIFWSMKNEYGAPWSWQQSAAQGWIPKDPIEKLYPFYSDNSASCLNTQSPLGTIPNFPNYPVDVVDLKSNESSVEPTAHGSLSGTAGPGMLTSTEPPAASATPFSVASTWMQLPSDADLVADDDNAPVESQGLGTLVHTGRADIGLSSPTAWMLSILLVLALAYTT